MEGMNDGNKKQKIKPGATFGVVKYRLFKLYGDRLRDAKGNDHRTAGL